MNISELSAQGIVQLLYRIHRSGKDVQLNFPDLASANKFRRNAYQARRREKEAVAKYHNKSMTEFGFELDDLQFRINNKDSHCALIINVINYNDLEFLDPITGKPIKLEEPTVEDVQEELTEFDPLSLTEFNHDD